ncbi:MAG: hypothetical protein ACR2NR_11880 [Solirubrobacteraceae bacterium]
MPVARNGIGHQHRERRSLLRLDERDVLNTLLTPPRLDLYTGRRLKPKRLIRDRLIKRSRERRDPVEWLLVPDRGNSEQNTKLPIDLKLVEVGARTELVEFERRP